MGVVIAADIGGTHARLARVDGGVFGNPQKIECAGFQTLGDALKHYSGASGGTILIATAAQPDGSGTWRFLNGNKWVLSAQTLAQAGWDVKILINDFAASACGAVTLSGDSLVTLRPGAAQSHQPCAVLGPGTGLGLAYVTPLPQGGRHVQETFGGHMIAAALTPEQTALIAALRGAGHDVVYEDIVSGRGLPVLYRAVCATDGTKPQCDDAGAIIAASQDASAQKTLRLFHEFLGLFAHNAAVTGHAFGGVYLDGGVIQKIHAAGLFDAAAFERGLVPACVPVVKAALQSLPVWLVNDTYVALRGLADLYKAELHKHA